METLPKKPKQTRAKPSPEVIARRTAAVAAKQGWRGYCLMPAPSHNAMRVYTIKRKDALPEAHKPDLMWWPELHDFDGARGMVDAIIERDYSTLSEMKLRYADHVFGFEHLIANRDRTRDVAECLIINTETLPRGYRLDFELVKTIGGVTQVRAALRRAAKTVTIETLYSSDVDEDDAYPGTADARDLVTMSESQGDSHE